LQHNASVLESKRSLSGIIMHQTLSRYLLVIFGSRGNDANEHRAPRWRQCNGQYKLL